MPEAAPRGNLYDQLWDSLFISTDIEPKVEIGTAALPVPERLPIGNLYDQLWEETLRAKVFSSVASEVATGEPADVADEPLAEVIDIDRARERRDLRRVGRVAKSIGKWASIPVIVTFLTPTVENAVGVNDRHHVTSAIETVATIPETVSATTATVPAPEAVATTAVSETKATTTTIPQTTTTTTEVLATTTIPETVSPSAPETTQPEPYSLMGDLLSGNLNLSETGGRLFDVTIDMPTICLNGIDLYGGNIGDLNDTVTLDILQASDKLTQDERLLIENGQASKALKADISQRFDPTYKVERAEQAQEDCGISIGSERYPARWLRTPQGSTAAMSLADEGVGVGDIQPVIGLDTRSAILCQTGNGVLFGHRTTEGAPFANLDGIKVGDPIVVTMDNGDTCTYMVESMESVLPTPEGLNSILNYQSPSGSTETLTVYTCDNASADRYVVRAVLQA